MKVITSNPILVAGQDFASFDGSRNTADTIKAFQYYVNFNDRNAKLEINGIWDEPTKRQGLIWGSRFDKVVSKYPNVVRDINAKLSGAPTSKGGESLELKLMDNPDVASTLQVPVGSTPTQSQLDSAKKNGLTWDKITGGWKKAEESGMIDSILGFFNKGKQQTSETPYTPVQPYYDQSSQKTGMSKGTKIALVVGGLALIGGIVYFATRKK